MDLYDIMNYIGLTGDQLFILLIFVLIGVCMVIISVALYIYAEIKRGMHVAEEIIEDKILHKKKGVES